MGKQYDYGGIQEIRTTLGKETVFSGKMRFTDSLKIEGRFNGEIISTGFLYIDEGAEVTADIKVRSLVVGGVVHGNITATEKLEMLPSGQVFGNVQTAKLRIADGVLFEGKCEMIKNPDTVDVFSTSAGKIKTTFQSVG